LLLPLISKAREKGRSAACMGNLKQIGAAMLAYAADHENRIYLCSPGSDSADQSWASELETIVSGNRDIFVCPSCAPFRFDEKGARWAETYGIGRDMPKRYLDKSSDDPIYINLGYASSPATILVVADSVAVEGPGKSRQAKYFFGGGGPSLIHLRHSGCANCLFLDGHVRACNEKMLETISLKATGGVK